MSDSNSPEKKVEEKPEVNAAEKTIDVLTVGNAMVDILVKANDDFLKSLEIKKGSMLLIDDKKAKQLFSFI